MPRARPSLDRDSTLAPVPPRLFGSFVEHVGRCVCTGIHEPGHPSADAEGPRGDVLDLVRELGPTVVRHPGGDVVSGCAWEDGVGPREQRPRRLDRAWRSVESDELGLGELVRWAQRAGTEVVMALDLGTRGVQEAWDLLECANHPSGTRCSDLRRSHGSPDPFDVRLWCLGDEVDGPWQVGHTTAREHGGLAAETARAMRSVDPRVELVACGSSGRSMPTVGTWEREVLGETHDLVDLVCAHDYYEEAEAVPVQDSLAAAVDMDASTDSVVATADAVGAAGRHTRRLGISVDEWNAWYQTRWSAQDRAAGRTGWDVDLVDAAATWDEPSGALALFVVNRSLTEPADLEVRLGGFGPLAVAHAQVLAAIDGQDRHTTDDAAHPGRVALRALDDGQVAPGGSVVTARLRLPPLSWSVVQLGPAGPAGPAGPTGPTGPETPAPSTALERSTSP